MGDPTTAYACGYRDNDSGGIYGFEFDPSNGRLDRIGRTPVAGAMYLTPDPDGNRLYAATNADEGGVRAYRIGDTSGDLVELNRHGDHIDGPAYLSVDSEGRYVFVANYGGGSVTMLRIDSDGQLVGPTDVVEHDGSSVDPNRQTEPHPHSAVPSPDDRFLYVPDLGTDRIKIYEVDYDDGRLHAADAAPAEVAPGAGPRHFAFHPELPVAYVINEMGSTVTVFERDAKTGALTALETADTLPGAFEGDNLCAEVDVHPSGEWLFASNRGHDSIAVMSVDGRTGRLEPVSHASTRGEWPRDFAVSPDGSFLFAENRDSDSIVAFSIEGKTGELTPTGNQLSVPDPICLEFV